MEVNSNELVIKRNNVLENWNKQKEIYNEYLNTEDQNKRLDLKDEFEKIQILNNQLIKDCNSFLSTIHKISVVKTSFYDFYLYNNSKEMKPSQINEIFEPTENKRMLLNFQKRSMQTIELQKLYIYKESFPKEISIIWDIWNNEKFEGIERIYTLLNDKYEFNFVLEKETNLCIGYWIQTKSKSWRWMIDNNNQLDVPKLIYNLNEYHSLNSSFDARKLMCYLLKDSYNTYNENEEYVFTEINWNKILRINKTLNEKMLWVVVHDINKSWFIGNGFYSYLPNEIDWNLDDEKIEKILREKYIFKRIYNRVTKKEIYCWAEKIND